MKSTTNAFFIAMLLALNLNGQTPPPIVLTRSLFPGGGGESSGGEFVMLASIGEPSTTLAGGGVYSLTSGAWVPSPPGDCAYDGVVSLIDYAQMVPCLMGPAESLPTTACRCFDLDASNTVSLKDFAMLQRLLD